MKVKINNRIIDKDEPVYFIADIASNHNGDLEHAKELIYAGAESGVDAIKMQNFNADTIVSDYGFKHLKNVKTHQSTWETSVYESYKAASIPFEWTLELKELATSLGIDYFTSPYSIEITKAVAPYVSAFKLGSGDITWHEEIEVMASFHKPVIIATGASTLHEVQLAMEAALAVNTQVILMQCNTNYTAKKGEDIALTKERFSNINLKVLEQYASLWPGVPLGLSDHTHGDLTVLGAVGLYGCAAVEKHFTLDNTKTGQDHSFSMMPDEWRSMVQNTAALKKEIQATDSFETRCEKIQNMATDGQFLPLIIGDGIKQLAANEKNTVIVQRRAIRTTRTMKAGEVIRKEDVQVLRPCPVDALPPYEMDKVIGKTLGEDVQQGDYIRLNQLRGL
ncbi:N-acetylneuraminate synthase family protein [Flavobacteriaceae bacterium F08102]|nr:N-acetylneuraminate synthase family protein [Flavobacteriaceae bacterium F08102]